MGCYNTRRRLDQRELDQLRGLLLSGVSIREVANRVGCGKRTVETWMTALAAGTCGCGRPLPHAGRCHSLLGKRFDPAPLGWQPRTRPYHALPADKIAEARRLRIEENLSDNRIAKRLGIGTHQTVKKYTTDIPWEPPEKREIADGWTEDEDAILERLYPRGTREEIEKALPKRAWTAITQRASGRKVRRDSVTLRTVSRTIHPCVERLREERLRLGLTSPALAARMNAPLMTLGNYERGVNSPPLEFLSRWIAALGLTLELRSAGGAAIAVEPSVVVPAVGEAVEALVGEIVSSAGVVFDLSMQRLVVDGRNAHVTRTEALVLERLARTPGKIVTKAQLHAAVYEENLDGGAEMKIVDVFMCKIRGKLGVRADLIETSWGTGYVWHGRPPVGELPATAVYAPRDEAPPRAVRPIAVPEPRADPLPRSPAPQRPPEPLLRANPHRRSTELPPTRPKPLPSVRPGKVLTPPPSAARATEEAAIAEFLAKRGATVLPGVGSGPLAGFGELRWDRRARKLTRRVSTGDEPRSSWGHR